jgi:CheY-like chemotaxis protein
MDKPTVLVVDDDPLVRGIIRDVLQSDGYSVLDARFNSEALVVLRQYQGPIHLMIADVMMPGINGRELAEMLAPSRPTMKVIYVSGYPEELVREKLNPPEMMTFLQKPFRADDLLRKVRETLQDFSPAKLYAWSSGLPGELTEGQLGMLYEIGIPTDYEEAYKWYSLAAATDGDERIIMRMHHLKAKMTPQQISRAERGAQVLREPKH